MNPHTSGSSDEKSHGFRLDFDSLDSGFSVTLSVSELSATFSRFSAGFSIGSSTGESSEESFRGSGDLVGSLG